MRWNRAARSQWVAVGQDDIQGRRASGDVLAVISDGLTGLVQEFYGRGPTRARSYYQDDLVVCVLQGGFSKVEETLFAGGRGASVIQQRAEFQEVMRERFVEVIERTTCRRVIGVMGGNEQHPDLMCAIFLLDNASIIDERSPRSHHKS
jgi:uncharacterized protein YbcI